jgi:hypothetical protein
MKRNLRHRNIDQNILQPRQQRNGEYSDKVKEEEKRSDVDVALSKNPVVVLQRISTDKFAARERPEELSEYEQIRLQNIQEREEMFRELGLDHLVKNISGSAKQQQSKKPVRKTKENVEPVRKSRRLAGGVPEIQRFQASFDDPQDEELLVKPRRRLAAVENYNDYLHATRTFTGNEEPESLAEVSSERFRILKVPKKCTIKQFVLSNNLEFKTGRGFYEFTKPEIISHKKEVVLVDKKTGEMFSGRDAKRMIGAGSGIRIPPTSFEKWRVFVQSTSYGRNLMGGTSFLYEV